LIGDPIEELNKPSSMELLERDSSFSDPEKRK